MVDDLLFRPDRNWLTSSGAGDLGMFGPLPQAIFAPANEDVEAAAEASQTANSSPPANDGSSEAMATGSVVDNNLPSAAGETDAIPTTLIASPVTLTPTNVADGFDAPAMLAAGQVGGSVISSLTPQAQAQSSDTALASHQSEATPALAAPASPLTVPTIIDPVAQAISLPADDALEGVSEHISTTVAAADALVGEAQDILGSDPTAGIATLVSLVTITDLIDLRDAGAETATIDAHLAMLDALTGDAITVDPLFAETHDDMDSEPVTDIADALPVPDPPILPVDIGDHLPGLG